LGGFVLLDLGGFVSILLFAKEMRFVKKNFVKTAMLSRWKMPVIHEVGVVRVVGLDTAEVQPRRNTNKNVDTRKDKESQRDRRAAHMRLRRRCCVVSQVAETQRQT
jgi:hypothetical protein